MYAVFLTKKINFLFQITNDKWKKIPSPVKKRSRHDTKEVWISNKAQKSCKVSLLLSFPNMHYLYVIMIDISSSLYVSSLHASFLYGIQQDGKICFVFFLVIFKRRNKCLTGWKYFDVGGYFRFAIVQVKKYERHEFLTFFSHDDSF